MAYWIQEFGGSGMNRYDFRMFHCDYISDINSLPLNDKEGVKQDENDSSYKKAHYGDQCFCLEDSSVWELRKEPNDWKKI